MSITAPQRWTRIKDREGFAALEEIVRALMAVYDLTLGRAHRGTWASSTAYKAGQVVYLSGTSYLALLPSTGKAPATETSYWVVLAAAGAAGSSGTSGSASPGNTQTVLAGGVDSAGMANFTNAGTGLAVDLEATATPLVLAFAYGYDSTGLLTYISRVTADDADAWSGLTASATNFLYVDRDTGTGALTYGQTTILPVYQAGEPAYAQIQQATGGTALSGGDAGANVASRAFDTDRSLYWASSQTGVGISGVAYIGYDFGAGVTQQVTGVAITKDVAASNITSVIAQWSTDGAAWTTISTHTLTATNGNSEIILPSSYTATRYFRLLANANLGGGVSWQVRQLDLLTKPSGLHWFDRAAMKMKTWDGSAWTTVMRVFVGEAVTDATTVTACSTYALRGEWDSGWFPVTQSTLFTKTHNLGLALPDGVHAEVYYSPIGLNHDAVISADMERDNGGSEYNFRWSATTANTTPIKTRLTLDFRAAAFIQLYGNNEPGGYFRIQLKRNW